MVAESKNDRNTCLKPEGVMKEWVRLGVVQGFGGIRRNKERRLFVAKENRWKKKVVMVVQVQRMVAPILRARG